MKALLTVMLALLAACGGAADSQPAQTCDEMQEDFDAAYFAGDEATMNDVWTKMADANCNPGTSP